ncbi:MAG: VTT domain-containing protein, partial [Nitrospiraceae bacterium]|nr:VTT domain-containing protein [Nitrospiraceae bacterium]
MEDGGGNRKNNLVWVKIGLLLLFLTAVFVLYRTGAFRFFMDRQKVIAFIDSLGPAGFLGFIALQTLQVVAAPIPGEVTGFIGGYLYGPALGIFLSTVGLTVGSLIAFTLSRIFGRPFVEKFVKKQTMEKYDYLLHHKGAFLVFLFFL